LFLWKCAHLNQKGLSRMSGRVRSWTDPLLKHGHGETDSDDETPLTTLSQLSLCWGLTLLGFLLLVADIAHHGLGQSNGKMCSFSNSVNSCASFRIMKDTHTTTNMLNRARYVGRRQSLLYMRSKKNSWATSVNIFVLNWLAKFGSQTVGSILLGETPVILQGPRHMISWLVALSCIQISPGDVAFRLVQEHAALRFIVRIACSLYKLRKFNFVLSAGSDMSILFLVLTELIVIDGNSIAQRACMLCLAYRLPQEGSFFRRLLLFLQETILVCKSILWRAAPLVTLVVLCSLTTDWPVMAQSMQLAVLILFLYRSDVHGIASRLGRRNPAGPSPKVWLQIQTGMYSALLHPDTAGCCLGP